MTDILESSGGREICSRNFSVVGNARQIGRYFPAVGNMGKIIARRKSDDDSGRNRQSKRAVKKAVAHTREVIVDRKHG